MVLIIRFGSAMRVVLLIMFLVGRRQQNALHKCTTTGDVTPAGQGITNRANPRAVLKSRATGAMLVEQFIAADPQAAPKLWTTIMSAMPVEQFTKPTP